MNIDFTFKDGVTVPLKIVANHYVDSKCKKVFMMAVLRENFVETPTDLPLNTAELSEVGELFQCVVRGLAQRTSDEFLSNPRQSTPCIGICKIFEDGAE